MANRKSNLRNAYESTLVAELSSVAGSMTVTDATGLTAPFYLVIEPANGSQREYVYCTGVAGATLTVSERYLSGSAAASGLTHPAGSTVRMAAFAQNIEDLHDRADDLQGQITAGGDHGGLTGLADDDHTQYLTTARHTALTGDHVTNGDAHTHTESDVTDLTHTTDHGALGGLADDDHTQYHTDARAVTWHDADDHSALEHVLVTFQYQGTLEVGSVVAEFPLPYNFTFTEVTLRCATTPNVTTTVHLDVDGSTINTSGFPLSTGTSVFSSFTDASHFKNQLVTVRVASVGATEPGADMTIVIVGTRD